MKFLILVIPVIYLILAVSTLGDYGINWDEPFHFNRGQAYLHYFLTGEKNYLNLPQYPNLKGSSDFMGREKEDKLYLESKSNTILPNPNSRRSYFQSDVFNFEFFEKNDGGGHPPANDILASFFNFIFYQKLGVIGDIEAYHLFEIIVAASLILAVSIFTYYNFGILASLVATFSLAFYPLFFSESHFNIKDPVETSFFGLTIILFYFGIIKKNWKLLIFSSILGGLALGTKFNALFLPFILIPWLVVYIRLNYKYLLKNKDLLKGLIFYPILSLFIFYILWPYLWNNPIGNLQTVVEFYKQAGTSTEGFNFFPFFWIFITTPLPILIFSILGLTIAIKNLFQKKQSIYLLLLLWFLVPIIRAILPGMSIHGGVRHIMEFIPAMAIFSGIGVFWVYKYLKRKILKSLFVVFIIILFSFVVLELIRLHPNENIYFNQLIGGLAGAKEKNIPFWGNSYGNAYLQGVRWLNQNAPENSKLALPIFNMVNVPRTKLRSDIDFSNAYFSGSLKVGEYVMEMSHNFNPTAWYAYGYLDKFLEPVYEVKIDGVAILKIWKNDQEHTKEGYDKETKYEIFKFSIDKNILIIELEKEIFLTKLEINHSNEACDKQKGGYIRLSADAKNWVQESETIDYPQIPTQWINWDKQNFTFLFTAKNARFIFLDTQMQNSCILKNSQFKIYGF